MIVFFKQFSTLEKIILCLVFFIYCNNLLTDVMEVDAAQYAGISAQMAQSGSYLEVKEFNHDYLDKPPLLFWLSSTSINIFGINNFAYKFPSFLFLLFSLFAVYRFVLLYYSKTVAKNTVLILATCQAYFLITNDVRTDSLLTSCVISAIWLLSEYFENRKLKFLIFGAIFIGLGMLAKGPIACIAILFPLGINFIYQKRWNAIFNWRWIIAIFIVALLLLPMSYGLYQQFDMHPEKVTNGVKGESGLYFYYWLQSFGRITGENVWSNSAPWFFFFTSTLWDFFPWILPFYFALFFQVKKLFSAKDKPVEIITLVGFVSLFAMLSLSKYKLPHYVFITFTFAAIMTSLYLSNLELKKWKNWFVVNFVLGILILALLIVYPILFFKEFSIWILICILAQLCILFTIKKWKEQSIGKLIAPVIVLNLFLGFVFYPKLLTFQSDSTAGRWALENIKNEPLYGYVNYSHAFNFYSKNPVNKVIYKEQLDTISTASWLYVDEEQKKSIEDSKFTILEDKVFYSYPITRLKLKFLLASSREKQLEKKHLLKIKKQ